MMRPNTWIVFAAITDRHDVIVDGVAEVRTRAVR